MKKFYLLLIAMFTISVVNAQWQSVNFPDSIVPGIITISGNNIFVGGYKWYNDTINKSCVCLSINNGNNWTEVSTGLQGNGVETFAINGNNIFAGTVHGIYLSTNNGNNWTAVNTGLTDTIIYSLAISGNNVFAGTHHGVYLSTNNGSSWSIANSGLPDSVVNTLAINGSKIFAGTYGAGIYLSTNNGSTWNMVNNGIPVNSFINALTTSGSNIFAVSNYGVYLSSDNGSNWTLVNTGLTDYTGYGSIVTKGSNIFVGSLSLFGVFLSTDNGNSWNAVNNGLDTICFGNPVYIQTLAINDSYIFAGLEFNYPHIWRRPLSELTGIKENTINNNLSIYPNPTKDNLTIETNHKTEQKIEIINLFGQTVYTTIINDKKTTINTSAFAKGVYILKLSSDKETVVRKFVKE